MKKPSKGNIYLALTIFIINNLILLCTYFVESKAEKAEEVEQEPIVVNEVVEVAPQITEEDTLVLVEEKTDKEKIDELIETICADYNAEHQTTVEPELVKSIVYHESSYNPKAINKDGTCVGLMQVSTFWHRTRAYELGVDDFFDPEGNITLGVDYLHELFKAYEDPRLVLMLYNMKHNEAFELYNQGKISNYAKSVLERAELLKNGGV